MKNNWHWKSVGKATWFFFFLKLGEGEEDFEETKIDSADKNFARFSIDVTTDDQWELHTLSIKDATMEDAGM